jgi:hypothetical protein
VTSTLHTDVAAWERILQQLEDDLVRAESALGPAPAVSGDTWTPPVGAPPLPEELLPRALDLLERQEAVLAPLTAALGEIVELRGAVTPRAGATHAPVRAAFLDIRA